MKTQNKKSARPFFDRQGKSGTYAFVMVAILLAVIIVVNLIVAALPEKFTILDTSKNGMFDISPTSEQFVGKLKEDITIYHISTGGAEDTILATFLERYLSMSERLTLKKVDPIADPTFLEKYNASGLTNNSLIIESERRYKVIDNSSFYTYYSEEYGNLTYSEYQEIAYYYQMYGQVFAATPMQYFDSNITGGIEYVTAERVPTVYFLSGHGEAALSQTVSYNLDYLGVIYSTLNIAMTDATIPDDCTCLVINTPTNDITDDERNKISSYLKAGGNLMLLSAPGVDAFENLATLSSEWGLAAEAGLVSEGDSKAYYTGNPTYIIPTVDTAHSILSTFGSREGATVLLANSHALSAIEASGITVTPLIKTTDKAFSTVGGTNGEAGVKVLAAVAEKKEAAGKFVWISSGWLLNDNFISFTNGGNFYLFYDVLNTLSGNYTSSLTEIPGVDLSEPTLLVDEASANIWGTIMIFIAPLGVIGIGIVATLRRRRR